MSKASEAFRTISEVADDLEVPKHVLRFWEVKFPQIRPMKRGGGRRYYRPEDLDLLRGIRQLLHAEGYMIKGVQKILREQGVDSVKSHGRAAPVEKAPAPKRAAPVAKTARAMPAAVAKRNRREAIAALIAELEACRQLLTGGEIGAGVQQSRGQRASRG